MKIRIPRLTWESTSTTVVVVVVIAAVASSHYWLAPTQRWVNSTILHFRNGGGPGSDHADEGSHPEGDGHDHSSHGGHDEATALELSAQAMKNIGLGPEQLKPVSLETFQRSLTVPALVVERPGRTQVQVATPLTGVVVHVHALEGEAVEPGTLLFQIRLTHEDLVQSQTDFLATLGELDVEEREIKRLSAVTNTGAVAGKVLLEREYARDKLNARLDAQREALRLHGLANSQIEQIVKDRRLLRELQIYAPGSDRHPDDELDLRETTGPDSRRFIRNASQTVSEKEEHSGPMVLQGLNVHKGQSVNAGDTLCVLSDYQELYIEGMAFEQDIADLRNASHKDWTVSAVFNQAGDKTSVVDGLRIVFLANQIHSDSRTLPFYVELPNEIVKDRKDRGVRHIEWKFLPGQRLQLRVPVEEIVDQIVLPRDAVAQEGVEYFVFQQNGKHFDRVPVHVVYRDQFSVVIANDGSLFPGDVVAQRGAHQMQMALKNKSGGGVDPHAGHNH